jgi:hypothetical protein
VGDDDYFGSLENATFKAKAKEYAEAVGHKEEAHYQEGDC